MHWGLVGGSGPVLHVGFCGALGIGWPVLRQGLLWGIGRRLGPLSNMICYCSLSLCSWIGVLGSIGVKRGRRSACPRSGIRQVLWVGVVVELRSGVRDCGLAADVDIRTVWRSLAVGGVGSCGVVLLQHKELTLNSLALSPTLCRRSVKSSSQI